MDLISFRLKFNHLSQHLHFNDEDEVEILVDGKPIKDVVFRIYHGHGAIDFISEGETDENT